MDSFIQVAMFVKQPRPRLLFLPTGLRNTLTHIESLNMRLHCLYFCLSCLNLY